MENIKLKEQHIICKLCCKTENQERVKELILEFVKPARLEEGCLYYDLYQEIEEPNTFYILDGWKNAEAVDAHAKHPNVARVMEKLSPLLLSPPKITLNKRISN